MAKWAVLVEDDIEQAEFNKTVLADAGFDTVHFTEVEFARARIGQVAHPIDLVVLDRRLPLTALDEPIDVHGDDLLDDWTTRFPDTPFIVFTGYTNIEHLQFSTRNRGTIDVGAPGETIDRVTPFQKSQTIEFGNFVQHLSLLTDGISDVEVVGLDTSGDDLKVDRRLLARVALHFEGVALQATTLTGGVKGLAVWHCRVTDERARPIACVVVKKTRAHKSLAPGGLHTLLPAPFIAAPIVEISGMCFGNRLLVMQSADDAPISAMSLLVEDDSRAARNLEKIAELEAVHLQGGPSQVTVAKLAEPLVDWAKLHELMLKHEIEAPRGTLTATTRVGAQHGDMHPSNILEVNDNPVLIDFDSETEGSMALDALTALLSPLFHETSPIRLGEWPRLDQCVNVFSTQFLDGCPIPLWTSASQRWCANTMQSERERWALTLAFAVRQLDYPDVQRDQVVLSRAVAIARSAASRLIEQ